jgi:hypothetical protein
MPGQRGMDVVRFAEASALVGPSLGGVATVHVACLPYTLRFGESERAVAGMGSSKAEDRCYTRAITVHKVPALGMLS